MNRGPPQQYNPNMNRGPPQQQQQQQQPPQQGYHPQQVQQQQQQQQHAQHPQYRGPPQQQQQQQYNNNARGPPPGRNIHPQHPQYRQQGGQPNYPQGPPQQQQQQQQQGGPMPQQHPQYRGPPPQQQYNPNQQPQGNQQQQQVQQQQMSQQQQPQQVGPPGVAPPNGQQLMQQQQQGGDSAAALIKLVQELIHHKHRERALLELSKKREALPDLAPILWHSFGTVAVLLQEIVSIYPLLTPPSLNAHSSNRVCNALALLQCVASHSETRSLFLQAHLPLYLYPFLNTVSKSRPFEYLRLTSLGVIGALVKMDDSEVINFLLQTEIIPLCLRIMETGSELSKTVATFIVQKILLDQVGLNYICATAERFYAVSQVLSNMVDVLVKERSARLLKHIVRCYARLCDNPRARDALRTCLPEAIRDQTFSDVYKTDSTINQWIQKLMHALHGGQ